MGGGSGLDNPKRRRVTRNAAKKPGKGEGVIVQAGKIESVFKVPEVPKLTLMASGSKNVPISNNPIDNMKKAQQLTASLRNELKPVWGVSEPILAIAAEYEAIIASQMANICLMQGRLQELQSSPRFSSVVSGMGNLVVPKPMVNQQPQLQKKQQQQTQQQKKPTFAVVLANADSGDEITSDQVKEKVLTAGIGMNEFIRVTGVRKLPGGKVAVITRTKEEAEKLKKNATLSAAGLKASEPRLAEPRLVFFAVPNELTDIQLKEAISRNLPALDKGELDSANIIRRQGKEGGETKNVIVDACENVRKALLSEGKLYVGFLSLRVRELECVRQCFGCGSFGHILQKCNSGGRLCHNCGLAGHTAKDCGNPVKCRNCTLRGLEASHRVNSSMCPLLQRECERMSRRIVS